MKNLLIASAVLLSTVCFGQTQPPFEKYDQLNLNPSIALEENPPLQVIYTDTSGKKMNKMAIFVNGVFISDYVAKHTNPKVMAKFSVEKGDVEIDNVMYTGKVLIETIADYKPSFISLNDFKEKHIDTKGKSILFQIDDEIVHDDYDKYIIDENYILKAVVENVKNKKLNFTLIKLSTRSEKNIKDSKKIMIRGREELAINDTL